MRMLSKRSLAAFLMAASALAAFSTLEAGSDHSAAAVLSATATGAKGKLAAAGKAESLMRKSDCFTCHSLKRKVVGPAYRDVAKKYKGDKGAVAMLVKKVKEGGAGNWGQVPMAGHPDLKDADAQAMVEWVLGQK